MAELIQIEIVFALPGRCWRERRRIMPGTTAAEALQTSELLRRYREHHGSDDFPALGIYGRKIEAGHLLADGDRLEIYRALTIDPRRRRRERVEARRDSARGRLPDRSRGG